MRTSTDRPPAPRRIAMWSPPRARSTMAMRVFEALGCAVLDEPFYAYWLRATNRTDDPGYAETVARHDTDWRRVIDQVLGAVPDGRDWYYQKHMAIHMLPEVDLNWMADVQNTFLIRHPAAVIRSMAGFRALQPGAALPLAEAARLVGIPQLERIYDRAGELIGGTPPVIDADDLLRDPPGVLSAFCSAVGLPFDASRPIRWAPGRHPRDGAWADAWYGKVFNSTELGPFRPSTLQVEPALQPLLDYCLPVYERLAQVRLR